MSRSTTHVTMHVIASALTALLLLGLTALPALAHATINPNHAPADSYARFAFRIGHGCEGSPTTQVAVQIPADVVAVKPELVPGWQYETVVGALDEPVTLHGEALTEGVREVRWFGGTPIPDDAFIEFGLSVRLPDAPGETLYFPVVQTCENGEHAWVQRPAEGQSAHDLDEPAPALTLTGGGGHGDGEADAATSGDEAIELGAATADAESAAKQARLLAVIALAVAVGAAAVATLRGRRA